MTWIAHPKGTAFINLKYVIEISEYNETSLKFSLNCQTHYIAWDFSSQKKRDSAYEELLTILTPRFIGD
jgi:hypothetical protein